MIKNVNSGDILKASDQNKIIDAINQLEAGSYSNNLKSAGYTKQRESYITLFQTKIQDSFKLNNRPKEYPDNKDELKIFKDWWIFLGKDLDTLKANVGNPDKIYVFNTNNEDVAGELQTEWIVRNGDGKFYDGWFDLQYDASSIDSVRVAWIDLWNKNDDDEKTTIESSYFCFTDAEDVETIKNQIEKYEEPGENQEFEVRGEPLIIATTTIPGYIEGADQPYTITQLVQLHIGRYAPDELSSDGNSTDTTSGLSVFNDCIQKSVDITNLSGDIYYKLYKFEDDERTDSETINVNKWKADILLRIKDDNAQERHLDYISLSNLSKSTDSEESQNEGISPQQYSIETRTNLSGDAFYQLYNFDDGESQEEIEEKDKADILIRKIADDGIKTLEYLNLGTLSSGNFKVDSEITDLNQESLDRKEHKDGEKKINYIQLHNFDNPTILDFENISSDSMLIRKSDGKTTLEYASIPSFQQSIINNISNILSNTVDSDITELNQQSLEKKTRDDQEYLQLYQFDAPAILDFKDVSADAMLIRKSDGNTSLKYASIPSFKESISNDISTITNNIISNLFISVDSEIYELEQKSLERKSTEEDDSKDYLQLYQFDNLEATVGYQQVKDTSQILLRDNKELKYLNLKDLPLSISVDSDITDLEQKSLDQKVNPNNVDETYIQLHNFDNDNTEKYEDIKETAQILIRDNKELKYLNIKYLSSGQIISGDANLQEKNNSINLVSSDTEAYYELYNFDKAESEKYADVSATGLLLLKNEKDLKYLSFSELSNVLSLNLSSNLSVDSQLPGKDQYSIDLNTSDLCIGPYLQLYQFDTENFAKTDVEDAKRWDPTVLIRANLNGDSPELIYVALSDILMQVPTDTDQAPKLNQFSIAWNWTNQDTGPFLQLLDFDMDTFSSHTLEEAKEWNSTILMRAVADGHPELIYVDLSSLSGNGEIISGDSQVLVDGDKSIKLVENSDKKKYYQLYDFDRKEADSLSTYPSFDKIHWVCRYNDNTITYIDAQESLKPYESIKGDSNYNIGYSIETKYDEAYEKNYHQIYGFDNNSTDSSWKVEPSVIDIENWMTNGSTTISYQTDTPGGPEPYQIDSIGRYGNEVVYTKLNDIKCMPFIHGDADPYVNQNYYSIEHVSNNDKTKTYYQLYGFKNGSFSYTANILSSATSLLPDKDDNDYDFVVRNNKTHSISYAKLKATAQVDLTEIKNNITNLGNTVNNHTTYINNLSNITINLSGDINDLSSQISSLTGNYWKTGGESDTNNCKTASINMLTCNVIGGGDLTCNSNIHMQEKNLDLGYGGTLYVSNIDSLTSYINIQKGIKVQQNSTFNAGLTCDSLQVNSATHFGTLTADNLYSTSFKSNMIECETTCYVNTLMSENNIMIGGTSLSEAQLKKLLALIN